MRLQLNSRSKLKEKKRLPLIKFLPTKKLLFKVFHSLKPQNQKLSHLCPLTLLLQKLRPINKKLL